MSLRTLNENEIGNGPSQRLIFNGFNEGFDTDILLE